VPRPKARGRPAVRGADATPPAPLGRDEAFLLFAAERSYGSGGRLVLREGGARAAGAGAGAASDADAGAGARVDPRLAPPRPVSLGALARSYLPELLEEGLSLDDERLLRKVARCRTSALGGALESCAERCGFAQVVFRSCGDRHCPGCGGLKGARWLEQRVTASLPVPSFHCVVTLRPELRPLARENQRAVYGLQLRAAQGAVQGAACEVLGEAALLGVTSVLHTWNRWGAYHPLCAAAHKGCYGE
jgi:hypothetical protein